MPNSKRNMPEYMKKHTQHIREAQKMLHTKRKEYQDELVAQY